MIKLDEPKIKPQLKMVAIYYVGECAGNAEQAAIKAGYSPKYARGNAYKLVARQDVQTYIEYLRSLTTDNPAYHIATIGEIQSFWTDIMEDIRQETKDRLRASEMLMKAQGGFKNEW